MVVAVVYSHGRPAGGERVEQRRAGKGYQVGLLLNVDAELLTVLGHL